MIQNASILIVDDVPANLDILSNALSSDYEVIAATDGEDALEAVEETVVDLILLDIMMPGMDGYEVCRRLKSRSETENIPVIFLTAMTEITHKTKGFSLGAVDYITKPFEIQEVNARVRTHLSLKYAQEILTDQNRVLEDMVKKRTREIIRTRDATIRMAASLAETRDNETGDHIQRTQRYIRILAEDLHRRGKFPDELDKGTISLLTKSAPLHDIGKIGVPDSILLKPGKLTDEEFDEMKNHTVLGRDALLKVEMDLGEDSFLKYAREIAYTHHEKWNGTGYPRGLKEEEIPLSGRLMALADVYDALISRRVYKPPMPHSKAVSIILEGKGSHFDPELIDCFLDLHDSFRSTALEFAESDEEKNALGG